MHEPNVHGQALVLTAVTSCEIYLTRRCMDILVHVFGANILTLVFNRYFDA